jgi:hypothetical protein
VSAADGRSSNFPPWLRWTASAALAGAALAAAVWLESWIDFRSPLYAFEVHFLGMGAAAAIDPLLAPRLDSRRFDVSPREVRLYRRLGVGGFMRLLQRIGWTRALADRRIFDGSRRTLRSYERATRHGENAHTWLFLLILLPMGYAALRGYWDAVLWFGSMNVLFHLYPVLLQRSQRARLQSLIRRCETRAARS